MIDLIKPDELDMIDYYRYNFGGLGGAAMLDRNSAVDTKDLLKEWESAKSQYLSSLFGDKLILTKEIDIEKPLEEKIKEFNRFASSTHFLDSFLEAVKKILVANTTPSLSLGNLYEMINNTMTLVKNEIPESIPKCTVNTPEGTKDFFITPGMKMMKFLNKMIKSFPKELSQYNTVFENTRLRLSMINNDASLKGEYCLSIHPLDYITMSENESDWSSCMNWAEGGCYRQGTVEMMNSPCVVVGYLKGSTPLKIGDNEWNNKRWRCLFVVEKGLICNVKGYPFENESLELEGINWLQQLANEKGNIQRYHTKYSNQLLTSDGSDTLFTFNTRVMYNDFPSASHNFIVDITRTPKSPRININYSGASQCMCCGETFEDGYDNPFEEYQTRLCCCNCEEGDVCIECGLALSNPDDVFWYDGKPYCWACRDELFVSDIISREEVLRDNAYEVIITDSKDNIVSSEYSYTIEVDEIERYVPKMICQEGEIRIRLADITQEAYDELGMRWFIQWGEIPSSEFPKWYKEIR